MVRNIRKKTPVLEPLFNKFVKRRLQQRCFAVNIANFLEQLFDRTPPVAASTGAL